MANRDYDELKVSDETGEAVLANITADRSVAATTIEVDSVDNWPAKFILATGNPNADNFITPATMTVMYGHLDTGDIIIDGYAPGYTDSGNTSGQIAIIKPNTYWTDEIVALAEVAHNNDGTLKDSTVTTAKISDSNVTTAKIADSAITTAKIADGAATSRKLAPTTFYVEATSTSSSSTVYADVTGSSQTFTPDVASYLIVTFSADIRRDTNGGGVLGLNVDGSVNARHEITRLKNTGTEANSATLSMQVRVALTAAAHTVKLQCKSSNSSTTNFSNPSWTAILIAQ